MGSEPMRGDAECEEEGGRDRGSAEEAAADGTANGTAQWAGVVCHGVFCGRRTRCCGTPGSISPRSNRVTFEHFRDILGISGPKQRTEAPSPPW